MTSHPSFFQLADQITDKKQFNDIIARQQKFFETNPYKIEKLYPETAKKIYTIINSKYQITKDNKVMDNIWQENERRVFVWYMILLVDLHFLNPQKSNQINWTYLSSIFFDKNPDFLEFQFVNILKCKTKITWNQEEDKILLQAMSKERPGKWNQVSKRIFYESGCLLFKSPKHCRERWFNHLDQSKNKGSWTLQEDYNIFKFIIENGKKWACIVKLLENSRTEHMIKNRYNSLISKLKKNKKRREQEIAELVFKSLQAQVKTERRERKLKNLEKSMLEKKSQNIQLENPLQQNLSKPYPLDQQKSSNSTDKIENIKTQYPPQIQLPHSFQHQSNSPAQKPYHSNEERPLLNLYNFPQQYLPFNPYQYFYMYQPSPYMPINPMMYH